MAGFRSKLVTCFILLILIVSLLFATFSFHRTSRSLEKKVSDLGSSLTESLANSSELAVLSRDPAFLISTMRGIAESRDVLFLVVYAEDGDILGSASKIEIDQKLPPELIEKLKTSKKSTERKNFTGENEKYYDFIAPITISGTLKYPEDPHKSGVIGFARLGISLRSIQEQGEKAIVTGAIMTLAVIILGIAGGIYLAQRMTEPLNKLKYGAEAIGKGNLDYRIKIKTGDEIEELAQGFNEMTKDLQQTIKTLEEERASLDIKVKERTKELLETQEQLIQSAKMATIGTLAGGVAHEINTPLGTILTNTEMLRSEIKNKYQKESLELIEESSMRCKTIVEQLLKYSRVSPLEFEPVHITQVIDETCILLEHQLSNDGITINKKYSRVPPVNGNANELTQVFTNIIVNARDGIKKTYDASRSKGNIEIRVFEEKGAVVTEVTDDGIGIPEKNLSKIFDPFFTTKDIGEGTGLGLSVSHKIIEKHKGKLEAKSKPDRGAAVRVELPLKL